MIYTNIIQTCLSLILLWDGINVLGIIATILNNKINFHYFLFIEFTNFMWFIFPEELWNTVLQFFLKENPRKKLSILILFPPLLVLNQIHFWRILFLLFQLVNTTYGINLLTYNLFCYFFNFVHRFFFLVVKNKKNSPKINWGSMTCTQLFFGPCPIPRCGLNNHLWLVLFEISEIGPKIPYKHQKTLWADHLVYSKRQ